MRLKDTLRSTESVSVQSVFICARQQWGSVGNTIIHAATRGHWSTANKHESQTDDSGVSWRRPVCGWKRQSISPALSDSSVLKHAYSAMPMHLKHDWWALTPLFSCGFTSRTWTAKGTFEFLGFTTDRLHNTKRMNVFLPVCALHMRVYRHKRLLCFLNNKRVLGCKSFGSLHILASQIHSFF